MHLMHIHSNFSWGYSAAHPLLLIVGLWYLFQPSTKLFVWSLLLALGVIFTELPEIDNHWLFVGFIDITMLLGFLFLKEHDVSSVLKRLRPVLCFYTISLYVISVIHKLNTDFFNPSTSCVLHIQERFDVFQMIPLLSAPEPIQRILILGVWLLLAAVPLCLAMRRTWFIAIVAGAVFHIVSAMYVWAFAVVMFVLYFLFFPKRVQVSMIQRIEKRTGVVSGIALITTFISVILMAQVFVYHYIHVPLDTLKIIDAKIFGIIATITLILFIRFIIRNHYTFTPRESLQSSVPFWMWIVPFLFVAQCFSPYAGLKTTTTLSMYSNVRTEAGGFNHLFIPNTLPQLGTYQRDAVRLIASLNPDLQEMADLKLKLPWVGLQQQVQRKASLPLKFERGGEIITVNTRSDYPELFARLPLLQRKFLNFRPFSPGDLPMICMW